MMIKYAKETVLVAKMIYLTFKNKPSIREFKKALLERKQIRVSVPTLSTWVKKHNWELEREGIAKEAMSRLKEEMVKKHVNDSIRKVKTLDAVESRLFDEIMKRSGRSVEGMANALCAVRKQRQLELGLVTERFESNFSTKTQENDLDNYIEKNQELIKRYLREDKIDDKEHLKQ